MIYFTSSDVGMPVIDEALLRRWLQSVAAGYRKKTGRINYIFCSDEGILEVNRQFLQHDYYTDIITFDYSVADIVSGDIFISVDTVRSNAEERNLAYEEELHRVVVHGMLHLTGQNDKLPDDRAQMTCKENKALCLLEEMKQD